MEKNNLYTCSVCGGDNADRDEGRHRELMPCAHCGSNARFRAIACNLVAAITGQPGVLAHLEPHPEVRGIGISDTEVYASVLRSKFSYTNTFLHTDPHVDIEASETFAPFRPLHFIVCSDVIEHTLRAPLDVLRNLFDALEPGGSLILSAPTYLMPNSIERYPTLSRFEVVEVEGRFEIDYETPFGTRGHDPAPVFHGGPGRVLELRVLAHEQLVQALRWVGFQLSSLREVELAPYGATWPAMVERADVPFPMNGGVLLARRPSA